MGRFRTSKTKRIDGIRYGNIESLVKAIESIILRRDKASTKIVN